MIAPAFAEKGFVLGAWSQHFLAGVTAEMMDWWWANMEKGYYLWAPGATSGSAGSRPPPRWASSKAPTASPRPWWRTSRSFGGDGVVIRRLDLSWFPFTRSLSHVIVEGVFNEKEEFCDCTVHMWEDVPGGVNHLTASVLNSRCSMPPAFVLECPEANPTDGERAIHAEYEASRWPAFLPALFQLWKGHPDPSQNVACDLTVV